MYYDTIMTLIWSRNKKLQIGLIILSFIIFLLANQIISNLKKPELKLSPQQTVINFDEGLVKALSLGQFRLVSSLLWSETLLKAGVEHHQSQDLSNWMFLRLKLITTLDPYFYSAYLYGGIYLSIIKDDDLGAEFIYDKALNYYPDDFYLNLNAAFHYYYEVDRPLKSINSLEKVVKDPRVPSHIPSFLSRLKAQSQSLKDTMLYLEEMLKTVPKETILHKRLRENLFNVRTEYDLDCLNKGGEDCEYFNLNGDAYLKNNKGLWISPGPWKKLRIKRKD